jgi:hypothetical protein
MATSETGKEQKSGYDGNLQIEYANNRIIVKDGTSNRLLLGETPEGDIKIKLSQPTKDVLTATSDQLIWSSDFNMLKIVDSGTIRLNDTIVGTDSVHVHYAHNLGYKPGCLLFSQNAFAGSMGSPWFYGRGLITIVTTGGNVNFQFPSVFITWYVTDTDLVVQADNFIDTAGYPVDITFKYYLFRETIT